MNLHETLIRRSRNPKPEILKGLQVLRRQIYHRKGNFYTKSVYPITVIEVEIGSKDASTSIEADKAC